MTHTLSAIVAVKTLTLVLGALITFYAYRASRRTGSRPLRLLAVGFSLVTLGAALAGLADQVFGVDTPLVLLIESSLTAVGFAVILYSLYAR